jgi:hypothetical protein
VAQQTNILLFDDLELKKRRKEVPADESLEFSLEGRRYQIDLTAANAAKFRTRFEPYTEVATRLPVNGAKQSRTVARRNKSAEIRAWARGKGYDVSERGRIPAAIVKEFEAVH